MTGRTPPDRRCSPPEQSTPPLREAGGRHACRAAMASPSTGRTRGPFAAMSPTGRRRPPRRGSGRALPDIDRKVGRSRGSSGGPSPGETGKGTPPRPEPSRVRGTGSVGAVKSGRAAHRSQAAAHRWARLSARCGHGGPRCRSHGTVDDTAPRPDSRERDGKAGRSRGSEGGRRPGGTEKGTPPRPGRVLLAVRVPGLQSGRAADRLKAAGWWARPSGLLSGYGGPRGPVPRAPWMTRFPVRALPAVDGKAGGSRGSDSGRPPVGMRNDASENPAEPSPRYGCRGRDQVRPSRASADLWARLSGRWGWSRRSMGPVPRHRG
ncbi:hypothetical protein CLV72_109156 [Allonocardiopsis opalescens]|uniref:Uncharacterized protein n=1 Tax=Allonocardiopsis opalescens TaxID=1144618 RepID=A0A2T0PVL8_9ACTN|nr:hypothetical protein CLV72_109156 [Allonocardiopsis opalescens]